MGHVVFECDDIPHLWRAAREGRGVRVIIDAANRESLWLFIPFIAAGKLFSCVRISREVPPF